MTVLEVFKKSVEAIRAGKLIERESKNDKEFHFQNWCRKRFDETGEPFEAGGRNSYPDFRMVKHTDGYEIKGLAYPGRDVNFDSNSQVPTGHHNGRTIYYVFGRYPKNPDGNKYQVVDLVMCHGDFLNADHDYVHKNKNVKGFGAVREQFICLFSGTLEFNNLFCSFKGEGTGAVRHMFSNHILKPERTPLENSVWGTHKSSGTFSTLFHSRLLRAQEYLRRPFEIRAFAERDKLKSEKVYSDRKVKPTIVESFTALSRSKRMSALLLNGDSASLPLPAGSVDAVVTDPPYFDFVHYSELSDFFFAWIAPVMRKDAPYFNRPDSSHRGEVQDSDPDGFAEKIGRVFSECHRVLKPGGILAFTFHHSAPDGWVAIHRALAGADFVVAAAHPVKAEMSVSNPKSAAKEPINLDAILVCRKRGEVAPVTRDVEKAIEEESAGLRLRFESIGRILSRGDRFVIGASQALHHGSVAGVDEARVRTLLENAYTRSHHSEPINKVEPAPAPPPVPLSLKMPEQVEMFDSPLRRNP